MERKIKEINNIVKSQLWFEFEIIKNSSKLLKVRGGLDIFDIDSPYELIIEFYDVFYIESLMTWQTNTSKNFLRLIKGNEAYKINKEIQVEQGYLIFEFLADDYDKGFIIIAKNIGYKIPLGTSSISINKEMNSTEN